MYRQAPLPEPAEDGGEQAFFGMAYTNASSAPSDQALPSRVQTRKTGPSKEEIRRMEEEQAEKESWERRQVALKAISIFQNCTADFVELLASASSEKSVEPGCDVFRDGTAAESIIVLIDSGFEVVKDDLVVQVPPLPSSFGEMLALPTTTTKCKWTVSLRRVRDSDEPARICELTKTKLTQALEASRADAMIVEAEVRRRLKELVDYASEPHDVGDWWNSLQCGEMLMDAMQEHELEMELEEERRALETAAALAKGGMFRRTQRLAVNVMPVIPGASSEAGGGSAEIGPSRSILPSRNSSLKPPSQAPSRSGSTRPRRTESGVSSVVEPSSSMRRVSAPLRHMATISANIFNSNSSRDKAESDEPEAILADLKQKKSTSAVSFETDDEDDGGAADYLQSQVSSGTLKKGKSVRLSFGPVRKDSHRRTSAP